MHGEDYESKDEGKEEGKKQLERGGGRAHVAHFSGATHENARNWMRAVELALQYNGVQQPERRVTFVGINLRGSALRWFHLREYQHDNWSKFREAFLLFFVRERKMGFIEWLHTVKQGPQQSVTDFALELRELIEQSEPKMSSKMRIEIFVAGLPSDIQEPVLLANVEDLQEAVRVARRYEAVRNSVRAMKRRGGARMMNLLEEGETGRKEKRDNTDVTDLIKTLTEQVGRLSEEVRRLKTSGGDRSNVTCYNCGQRGHISTRCPEARKQVGECAWCQKKGHTEATCRAKKVECFICHKTGHYANRCPSKDKDRQEKG